MSKCKINHTSYNIETIKMFENHFQQIGYTSKLALKNDFEEKISMITKYIELLSLNEHRSFFPTLKKLENELNHFTHPFSIENFLANIDHFTNILNTYEKLQKKRLDHFIFPTI